MDQTSGSKDSGIVPRYIGRQTATYLYSTTPSTSYVGEGTKSSHSPGRGNRLRRVGRKYQLRAAILRSPSQAAGQTREIYILGRASGGRGAIGQFDPSSMEPHGALHRTPRRSDREVEPQSLDRTKKRRRVALCGGHDPCQCGVSRISIVRGRTVERL